MAGLEENRPIKLAAIGVGVCLLIVAAIGVTVWLTSDNSKSASSGASISSTASTPSAASLPAQPSPTAYAHLYKVATIHKTTLSVLPHWPKPYQIYLDGTGEHCYEWFDRPSILYNLCFKNGVLADKSLG